MKRTFSLNQQHRRLWAVIVAATMLLTLLPSSTLAASSGSNGLGNYVVALQTDPDTSTALTTGVGSSSGDNDGRVWTDKSVSVVNGNTFEVTLSALAQEYKSTATQTNLVPSAADVVLVIDMSSSMTMNGNDRVEPMINAVNKAIDIIMAANPNNRISVHSFGTNANIHEIMPLAAYSNDATGQTNTDNRYITVTDSNKIYMNSGLKQVTMIESTSTTVNIMVPGTERETSGGTATQPGLYAGISKLIENIKDLDRPTFGERHPYVLLFTDGAANYAYPNWYDLSSPGTGESGDLTNGDATRSALTILSAAKLKADLTAAYNNYNGITDEKTVWFNVGLLSNGTTRDTNTFATAVLDPAKVTETATGNWRLVYDEFEKNLGSYTQYGPDGSPGHIFADENIYYATDDNLTPLNTAFTALGELVKTATELKALPIEASGASDADVVFTDVLGEGMKLGGAPKLINTTGTVKNTSGTVTTYDFTGYSSTASYDSASRTLVWKIPANELPLIMFEDRQDPQSGSYGSIPSPIRLVYTVVADGTYGGDVLYSNAFTTAESTVTAQTTVSFTPMWDNPYYYTVSEGASEPKTLPSVAKTQNASGTAPNAQSYAWGENETAGLFTVTLGNNGRLAPKLSINKASNRSSILAGDTLKYTVTVTNLTGQPVSSVVVGDTLPAVLTFVGRSISINGTPDSSATFPLTIDTIPANGSVTITYTATMSQSAPSGNYVNSAKILSVSGTPLSTPAEATKTVSVGIVYPATVTVNLDNKPYAGRTVTLLQGESSISLTGTGGQYTANAPAGTYDISVNGSIAGELTIDEEGGQAVINYYTVTFYDGSTAYQTPAPQIVLSGEKAFAPSAPSKSGYTFGQWKSQNGGSTAFDFNTLITAPTSVYASWTANGSPRYVVSFQTNGGSTVSAIGGILPGSTITASTIPSRLGYVFKGWYTDATYTTLWNFEKDTVHTNITLYAKWVPVSATVPLTGDDGLAWHGLVLPAIALMIAGAAFAAFRKNRQKQ